jgi:hypothetical protein
MIFWIISWISFFILRLPSLFEPFWYGDEGIYLTLGQAIRRGIPLYAQIHDNKPPLLYFIASIWPTVFGFRLILFISMIFTVWFFYVLALKFVKPIQAKISTFIFIIFSSIPLIEGNIANAEIFMLLPTILGVIYFLSYNYFWSGILIGLAFAIKVPVAAEALILFFWMLFFHPKKNIILNVFKYLIGCALPIFIFTLYYLKLGVVKIFLGSALFQNFGYLGSWSSGTHKTSPLSGGLGQRGIIFLIFNIIIFTLVKKKILNQKTGFLLSWLSATIFGSLLSGRPYPHYLIQLLPPLCILTLSLWIIPIIILLFFVIKKYNFYFYKNISYYQNFYQNGNKPSYFGYQVDSVYSISQYVVNNTSPNERIFIWGDEPSIYALSNRLPVGRYTVAYHITDFNAHEETISSLKKTPPPIIIYYAMSSRPFPDLDEFLNDYYLPETQIGKALLFKLKK